MRFKPNLTLVVSLIVMTLMIVFVTSALNPVDAQEPESQAKALGTAFTYQGRLTDNGNLANGIYDFQFAVYYAVTGGTAQGNDAHEDVVVSDGLFTVQLDFGDYFTDDLYYLEIAVRRGAETGGHTTLTPREMITPAPISVIADRAFSLSAPDGNPDRAVVVANNGNVGIGTNTPQRKLHVVGNRIRLENGSKRIDLRADGAAVDLYTETSDLYIRTTTGHHLLLNSGNGDGDVGVGTTNPQAQLDVNGDIKVKGSSLIRIIRFENRGNNANFNTHVSANDYYCVATGWSTLYDIQESDPGVNMVWTYQNGATWWARVQLRSHAGENENPDIDILCFRKEIASWEGASPTLNDPDFIGGPSD